MQKLSFKKSCYFLIFILAIGSTTLRAQKTITFYANISEANPQDLAGHVWVSFNDGGSTEVIGFYPGGIRDDSSRNSDVDYTFPVLDEAYSKAHEQIEEYQDKRYILGFQDCRSFAASVARAAGLKVPAIGVKSPAEWMGALVEMN